MDVKYTPADWKRMREGIGDLIGLGRWGKGMIDSLKELNDNLEDAKAAIAELDHDGVISFQHESLKSKYDELYEDFEVLHSFAGKVGDIVDRTIDEPFYKGMDAFVEAMRDLDISKITTKNRIGATETKVVFADYGEQQTLKVPKTEVSIDDLFSGGNYYSEQMKLEYEKWKELNPNQKFSEKDYEQAALHTGAFQYESIRDRQEKKEFWGQIAAAVVIVGATLICPPAGMALGAAYGALELGSAVSGKDWISGRELGTDERIFRGVLSPLDIVPGINGLSKLTGTVRLARISEPLAGLRVGIKQGFEQGTTKVENLVKAANKGTIDRLRALSEFIKGRGNWLKNKVAKDIIEVGRAVDSSITNLKNSIPNLMGEELQAAGVGKIHESFENTHAVENWLRSSLSKIEGINLERTAKGTIHSSRNLNDVPRIDEIEVTFKRNPKHDPEEFARQLKDQEKGMNELTVDEYLKNREKYIEQVRAIEGNAAQQAAREEAYVQKVNELQREGLTLSKAKKQAKEWLDTQAALHNPDQIAGGKAEVIGGLGDKRINSSIGSQWRYRIDIVDEQIKELAKSMTPEQLKNTYLNVKLTH